MEMTKTILVVDDELSVLRATARTLRNHGYVVLEADDGAEALRVLNAHHCAVDLVLVDYNMPPMNGPQFVAQAIARCPVIAVLFYTGYELIDLPENYVRKGCTQAELIEAVERKLAEE